MGRQSGDHEVEDTYNNPEKPPPKKGGFFMIYEGIQARTIS